ncbi:unnamed protein product, partial [Ranitomeya imitator]
FYSLVMCFSEVVQSNGGPQNIELSKKSLMLKVSPVIINHDHHHICTVNIKKRIDQ